MMPRRRVVDIVVCLLSFRPESELHSPRGRQADRQNERKKEGGADIRQSTSYVHIFPGFRSPSLLPLLFYFTTNATVFYSFCSRAPHRWDDIMD